VVSTSDQVTPLRYAAVFIAAHIVASASLGGLLLFVRARFEILGLPASHTVVLVGVGILTAWIFVLRQKRLPNRSEFRALFLMCAVYLVGFDTVLSIIFAPAYPAEARPYVIAGHATAALIDILFLYLALKFPVRWITRRDLESSVETEPTSAERP
jgi:hypothetical protein